ncbi:hypothetical protein [Winogradskyella sp.]|uniref:hypothetical protein n=1 Tax=Winogradskyella sp. TaxID=1883156 RepID=UPI002635F403|nr:hypothetical protein [Winogradskyella sp.]
MNKQNIITPFVKSQLGNTGMNLIPKESGREGVDFLIGTNDFFLQSIDLDTIDRSAKIVKKDLGKLRDNLFIILVLIIEEEPRMVYIIPSKDLSQSESEIFISNDVSLMPSLSNWEIRISVHTIPKLVKYSLESMIDKLKT